MDPNRYRRMLSLSLQASAVPAPVPPADVPTPPSPPRCEIAVDGLCERYPIHPGARPFLVVGRSKRCDLRLPGWSVSPRHAYLQLFHGGVYCVDLASAEGTFWNGGRRRSGWIRPQHSVSIGPFRLTCRLGDSNGSARSPFDSENLVSRRSFYLYESRAAELIPLNARTGEPGETYRIRQPITLVGRSYVCRPRLDHPSVGRVHCSLVATSDGLQLADLRTRAGTRVNGRRIRSRLLRQDDEVCIGEFRMAVNYPDAAAAPPAIDDGAWRLDGPVSASGAFFDSGVAHPDGMALLERFLNAQHEAFAMNHEQTMLMARLLGESQQNYHEVVKAELERIRRLDEQIDAIRAQLAADAARRSPPPDDVAEFCGLPPQQEETEDFRSEPPANEPPGPEAWRPRGTPEDRDCHARLVERMAQLEHERSGRVKRVIQTLCGVGS